jgi:hypothetical protein
MKIIMTAFLDVTCVGARFSTLQYIEPTAFSKGEHRELKILD